MRSHRSLLRRLALAAVPAAVLLSAQTTVAHAQQYFGQNQVQYEQFEWKVMKTEHFDVHFYPSELDGAKIVARMAERSYARLSRLMGHTFRERKPIVVFASRGDFAQNNVTGDLGEGTGGVTDALHQRNMFFFGQDLAEVEHVMTHEMVHQFQYDILFSGRGNATVASLSQSAPPLWFAEGMAEYLSIGPDHPATDAVIRDAALNGHLPTIEQMTDRPDQYFPYRYGESLFRYVGGRWGDEIIGEIMQASVSLGVERAFKRHTGYELSELGDEWRETMQTNYLPGIASLERPRKVATPLLNEKKTGGIIPVYIAPALSSDGRQIAYISTGSLLRAEVFLDLYLADASTGKRLKRLTNSVLNPETEELRYGYSQSAFSPDGRTLAYTGLRKGKDVLFLLDVKSREVVHRLDTGLTQMIGPSWSPDGRRIVFSGSRGGFSNLFMIDADGRNLRQLTTGAYAGLMPSWSPDGRRIAFVSDRGPGTDVSLLKFGKWQINIFDLQTATIETIPGQGGKNLNPSWAPDGKSLAFISDRTGISQIFLYDFDTKQHYQLTKFLGGVQSITENSPALSWARQADKLAFVYFDDGNYTVWSLNNPRQLKKEPYIAPASNAVLAVASAADSAAMRNARAATSMVAATLRDSTDARRQSIYRSPNGTAVRASADLPSTGAQNPVSVAALHDSLTMSLPTEESLKIEPYHATLHPEAISRPQIGYAQNNFGRGVYGGSAILFGDLLGNRQLLVGAAINGRIEEAQVAVNYASYSKRLNFATGFQQQPYFQLFQAYSQDLGGGRAIQTEVLARYIQRQAYFAGLYPLNRFNRFEVGASFTNLDRALMYLSQGVDYGAGFQTGYQIDSITNQPTLNYTTPYVAYVSDDALMGSTGPIYGHRYRIEADANLGKLAYMNYSADLRRYDAIVFSFLTLATRFYTDEAVGPGENIRPKYIGIPQYIRGYDRENYLSTCGAASASTVDCGATQLLGTRVVTANAELRFPLIRRFDLGFLPISLPPLDGLFFYDAGMAWTGGQKVSLTKPANYDQNTQRYLLRSYGFGLRLNLFNLAVLRWDYAVPLDSSNRKGYWWFTLGPSF